MIEFDHTRGGGQVEEGESLIENARREAREETGLSIESTKVIHADGRNAKNGEFWVVIFSVAQAETPEVTLSDEHDAFEWVTRHEFAGRESSERIRDLLNSDISF